MFKKSFFSCLPYREREQWCSQKIFVTYAHNWSLPHFSQDYKLAFRTIYVGQVNVIHDWRDLQIYSLMSTPNDRFLRNFFKAILLTFRVFARNLVKGSR